MCTVGIEETATVCSPLLDELLRRNGTLGDQLLSNLPLWIDEFRSVVRPKILNDTLRYEDQRTHNAEWQQHPKRRPRHVYPEISDRLHLPARDAANKNNREGYSHRSGNKIVVCKPRHLCEVAHRRFGHVRLP